MAFEKKPSTAAFPQVGIGESRARIEFPELPRRPMRYANDPDMTQWFDGLDEWYERIKDLLVRTAEPPDTE